MIGVRRGIFVWWLAELVAVVGPLAASAEPVPADVFRATVPHLVEFADQVHNHIGWGIITGWTSDSLTIVTANHVVDSAQPVNDRLNLWVAVDQGPFQPVQAAGRSIVGQDLAVLTIAKPAGFIAPRGCLAPLQESRKGVAAWAIGGTNGKFDGGAIGGVIQDTEYRQPDLLFEPGDLIPPEGESGGPIVTPSGMLAVYREWGVPAHAVTLRSVQPLIGKQPGRWDLTTCQPNAHWTQLLATCLHEADRECVFRFAEGTLDFTQGDTARSAVVDAAIRTGRVDDADTYARQITDTERRIEAYLRVIALRAAVTGAPKDAHGKWIDGIEADARTIADPIDRTVILGRIAGVALSIGAASQPPEIDAAITQALTADEVLAARANFAIGVARESVPNDAATRNLTQAVRALEQVAKDRRDELTFALGSVLSKQVNALIAAKIERRGLSLLQAFRADNPGADVLATGVRT